jgi:hypothetical protein
VLCAAFNKSHQVFPSEAWRDLVLQLKACWAAGLPLVATAALPVLPNPSQGIPGGYTANTVWLFLSAPTAWRKVLPPAVTLEVEAIENFPYISTGKLTYTRHQVGLMVNCASWTMRHPSVMGPIQRMLHPSATTTSEGSASLEPSVVMSPSTLVLSRKTIPK